MISRYQMAYIPFGGGPGTVGRQMAMMESILVVAKSFDVIV